MSYDAVILTDMYDMYTVYFPTKLSSFRKL